MKPIQLAKYITSIVNPINNCTHTIHALQTLYFSCSMMHYTCDTHQQSKEGNIKYLVREVGKQSQNTSSAIEREESLNGLGCTKHTQCNTYIRITHAI